MFFSSCWYQGRKPFCLTVNTRFWRILSFNRVISCSQCLRALAEFLRDRASSCSTPWKVSEVLAGEDKGGMQVGSMCVCPSVRVTEFFYQTYHWNTTGGFNSWHLSVKQQKEGYVVTVNILWHLYVPAKKFHSDLAASNFGQWRTAWKLAQTGGDVRTVGRYVCSLFLCHHLPQMMTLLFAHVCNLLLQVTDFSHFAVWELSLNPYLHRERW